MFWIIFLLNPVLERKIWFGCDSPIFFRTMKKYFDKDQYFPKQNIKLEQ